MHEAAIGRLSWAIAPTWHDVWVTRDMELKKENNELLSASWLRHSGTIHQLQCNYELLSPRHNECNVVVITGDWSLFHSGKHRNVKVCYSFMYERKVLICALPHEKHTHTAHWNTTLIVSAVPTHYNILFTVPLGWVNNNSNNNNKYMNYYDRLTSLPIQSTAKDSLFSMNAVYSQKDWLY